MKAVRWAAACVLGTVALAQAGAIVKIDDESKIDTYLLGCFVTYRWMPIRAPATLRDNATAAGCFLHCCESEALQETKVAGNRTHVGGYCRGIRVEVSTPFSPWKASRGQGLPHVLGSVMGS